MPKNIKENSVKEKYKVAKKKEVVVVVDGNNIDEIVLTGILVVTYTASIKDPKEIKIEEKIHLNDGRIYDKWPLFMFLGNQQFKLHRFFNMPKNDNIDAEKGTGEMEYLSTATYKISQENYMPAEEKEEILEETEKPNE